MNNEEKIKEIVREQPYATQNDNYATMIEYGARKMAEWKDKQFEQQKKEFLERACKWLAERKCWDFYDDAEAKTFSKGDIKEFRKYMEEE